MKNILENEIAEEKNLNYDEKKKNKYISVFEINNINYIDNNSLHQ